MTDHFEPTSDQIEALAFFAKKYGRGWKQKLIDAWVSGEDIQEPNGVQLRSLRTWEAGGAWLFRFQLPPMYAVKVAA